MWAQRPRRDCGTTFRQHFEVQELCVGSYVRVDEGRRLSQLCARRRLGHLQLCFSRRYPKPELLAERLPPGAPGCLNVQPLLGDRFWEAFAGLRKSSAGSFGGL